MSTHVHADPSETSSFEWDEQNHIFGGDMIVGCLLVMVSNIKDLCSSINETHREFNSFSAFSKRVTAYFGEWKKKSWKINVLRPVPHEIDHISAIWQNWGFAGEASQI